MLDIISIEIIKYYVAHYSISASATRNEDGTPNACAKYPGVYVRRRNLVCVEVFWTKYRVL
jgi:hypothetical protein